VFNVFIYFCEQNITTLYKFKKLFTMKKLSYLLGLLVVAGLILSSCSKDDEAEILPPTIAFLGGIYQPLNLERVDGDVTVSVGEQFVFGISASKGDKDLRRVYIERVYENVATVIVLDSTFSSATFQLDIITFAYPTAGTEDFTCTVWDKNDKSATIGFTVTIEVPAPDIVTYEDKILGAQFNATGSSFASIDGTVYTIADAKANSEKVDFLYFFGATNEATLAAPDDADAAEVFDEDDFTVNALVNWTTLNPTRFKVTTLTSDNFDDIINESQLVPAVTVPSQPTETKSNHLEVGDVLGFKTFDEKFGLIRIDAITGLDNTGTIKITVKVQE